MNEKTIKSIKKYACSFLELYEDEVVLSNDKLASRVVIKHPGGASVLPITKDHQIVLTKQHRYPIGQNTIEIPAGKKDFLGEDGLSCAARELEEETGYVSSDIRPIYALHPCLGYSNELLDIFIAFDCIKKEHPKAMDEDEHIEVILIDKKDILPLLESGQITDGKTIIALQYYLIYHT
jgi:ADP-ribose pyrophosphatase